MTATVGTVQLPFVLPARPHLDAVIVTLVMTLLLGGLVILASASMTVAEAEFNNPFHYVERQLLAIGLGFAGAAFMLLVPIEVWQRLSGPLVLAALVALALVLVPGVGLSEKGATRWVSVAGFTVQVSDPARLALILYVAGYLVRQAEDVNERFAGFLKPMLVISVAAALLLAEPDFGAATVLVATSLAMLFIGGARVRDFLLFALLALGALAALAVTSPYRLARLTGFLKPWDDPFNSGFQLTQSLIAIGRGEWFGVGLGASVQKLFYLPEAHTDFVFAVFAEEFGLLGSLALVGLFLALVLRVFSLSRRAAAADQWFAAYVALGLGVWLGLQSFINLGVNMGMLPTKGLTLPLISYGRSSLIMTLVSIGLLLRIHHELEQPATLAKTRKRERRR
ncbi:MAG: putative lipid II flippase FtsW [Pseudomonadota bacterium]